MISSSSFSCNFERSGARADCPSILLSQKDTVLGLGLQGFGAFAVLKVKSCKVLRVQDLGDFGQHLTLNPKP